MCLICNVIRLQNCRHDLLTRHRLLSSRIAQQGGVKRGSNPEGLEQKKLQLKSTWKDTTGVVLHVSNHKKLNLLCWLQIPLGSLTFFLPAFQAFYNITLLSSCAHRQLPERGQLWRTRKVRFLLGTAQGRTGRAVGLCCCSQTRLRVYVNCPRLLQLYSPRENHHREAESQIFSRLLFIILQVNSNENFPPRLQRD